MFGNFPEDWIAPSPLRVELIVYVILYFLVVFLLVQNFLLAIVVEVLAPPSHLLLLLLLPALAHSLLPSPLILSLLTDPVNLRKT